MSSLIHPRTSDAEFVNELDELAYEIVRYGFDRLKPDPSNSLEMIRLRQLVHEGWKKGQDRALSAVRAIVDELAEIQRKVKNANRRRDRDGVRTLREAMKDLEFRLSIVRQAIDAILWNIFANQHHVLRRFSTGRSVKNLDAENLFRTMSTVDALNEDPNKFALACDLTTFMHVADVVIIDQSDLQHPITIAEIKSGKVNEKCFDIMQQFQETGCPRNLVFNLQELTESQRRQFQRFANQAERASSVREVIETGKGTDLATGERIAIPEENYVIDSYEGELMRMFAELNEGAKSSLGQVSGCLHLGLYSERRLTEIFEPWLHAMEIDGLKWDYMQVFNMETPRPTLSLGLPFEFLRGLYTGKLRLLACLDLAAWFEATREKLGCDIGLETSAVSKRLRDQYVLLHKGQAICIRNEQSNFYLGGGTLSKIAFDFYDPVDAIRPFLSVHGG